VTKSVSRIAVYLGKVYWSKKRLMISRWNFQRRGKRILRPLADPPDQSAKTDARSGGFVFW